VADRNWSSSDNTPKQHEYAVAVERLRAHYSAYENSVYKIRWFALPTWYPAGKDFSMTCSWWSTLDSSSRTTQLSPTAFDSRTMYRWPQSVIGSPECNFSTGTNSGVPCDSTQNTVGQLSERGNTFPITVSCLPASAGAIPRHAGVRARLFEEHADARDQAVVALLEEDAFGAFAGGTVDLEGFGQLDV